MKTEIEETFEIQAPIDEVWAFLMDPNRVAHCMPGAELDEVVDERVFTGDIKLKLGFVTVRYRTRGEFTDVDKERHSATVRATGVESGGGESGVTGTLTSVCRTLASGATEVTVCVQMSLGGRMVEFGRGMIRSVARQLTKKFVSCAKQQLELDAG